MSRILLSLIVLACLASASAVDVVDSTTDANQTMFVSRVVLHYLCPTNVVSSVAPMVASLELLLMFFNPDLRLVESLCIYCNHSLRRLRKSSWATILYGGTAACLHARLGHGNDGHGDWYRPSHNARETAVYSNPVDFSSHKHRRGRGVCTLSIASTHPAHPFLVHSPFSENI